MFKPLDDIKIVELSTATAGPAGTKILVEYGADCIVVEPKGGIVNRNLPQHFDYSFTHKKSIIVDLKTEKGKEVVYKLLEDADIFMSNYRYRAVKKLGFDYETLHAKYPKLICAYLSGYGEYGEMKDAPGFDNTAFWGRAGLIHDMIEGDSGVMPISPSAVGDISSGAIFAMGMLAAIRNRDKTGEGIKVTTSLLEIGLYFNHSQMLFTQLGVKYPKGMSTPNRAMSNTYKVKDGYIYLITLNFDRDFPKLLRAIGLEQYIGDPRWTCMQDTQGEGAIELSKILQSGFINYTVDELREIFRENELAFGEFRSSEDELHDPQAEANGYLSTIKYPDGKEFIVPNSPVQYNDEKAPDIEPSVPAGFNTRDILKEAGYSEEEIQTLLSEDCVRTN